MAIKEEWPLKSILNSVRQMAMILQQTGRKTGVAAQIGGRSRAVVLHILRVLVQ